MFNDNIKNILIKTGIHENWDTLNVKIINNLNQEIINKLTPQLKKLLISKNIFYDIDINGYRIRQSNSRFTYSIEYSLTMILRQPFIFFNVDNFSFFYDIDWNNIVQDNLSEEEVEIYNSNINVYIHGIVLNLFYNKTFFFVPNKKVDLLIEFNDRLVFFYDAYYLDIKNLINIDYMNLNIASILHGNFSYININLPIYFIFTTCVICNNVDIYLFLHRFFFEYIIFHIGFFFSKKTITEIISIDIDQLITQLSFVLEKEINKQLDLSMLSVNLNQIINDFLYLIYIYITTIILMLYSNSNINYKTNKLKFETEFKFESSMRIFNCDYISNFKLFLKNIICFLQMDNPDLMNMDINNYTNIISGIIIEILINKDSLDKKLFIDHIQLNYNSKLIKLFSDTNISKTVNIMSELNKSFMENDIISFLILCIEKYNHLLIVSHNFSIPTNIKYYNYFLEFFNKS